MSNLNINFGGAGGHYSYLLGIADVLQSEFELNKDNITYSGVSAGCFPALFCCLNINVNDVYNNVNIPTLQTLQQYNSKAFFNFLPVMKHNLLLYINNINKNLYTNANNKLLCTLTHVPSFKSHIYSNYINNEDLIDCAIASGHIPVYSSKILYNYRNKYYIDGIVSKYMYNNGIIKYKNNLNITCDMFRKLDTTHLFISSCTTYSNSLYNLGKQDALDNLEYFNKFLKKK